MKVAVVGTGSIGHRHMTNLLLLGHEVGVYSHRFSAAQAIRPNVPEQVTLFANMSELLTWNSDAVVIANRTDQHVSSALQALQTCQALYIEKPLAARLDEALALMDQVETQQAVVELGLMLRAHPNLRWIKAYLDAGELGEVISLRALIGQWLPDWRPTTDHRQGFGAHYRYGGGVIMELIHEIDLARWMLGDIVDVCAMHRKLASLDIETEALAHLQLQAQSGALAQIQLDYIRPSLGRTLEIMGTKGILQWDNSSLTVRLLGKSDSDQVVHQAPANFERNHMFLDHMQYFLNRVHQREIPPRASLLDGMQSLRIALACHASAQQRQFVRPSEVSPQFKLQGGA